jgi:predicted amidophosphoribosyltransferase
MKTTSPAMIAVMSQSDRAVRINGAFAGSGTLVPAAIITEWIHARMSIVDYTLTRHFDGWRVGFVTAFMPGLMSMNTGHPQESGQVPRATSAEEGTSTPAPRRFVWPPIQEPAAQIPQTAANSGEICNPRASSHAKEPPVEIPSATEWVRSASWRAWWQSFERTWLEFESPPLAERLAEEAWQPDHPSVYCPRCGHSTGPFEADRESGCSRCRNAQLPWQQLVRLGSYEGLLRALILEIKLTRWRRLGHDLGFMLGRQVAREVLEAGLEPGRVWICPVPMSWARRMIRGIDHTMVIARGIADGARAEVGGERWPIVQALTRAHRPPQAGLSPTARRANVAKAFRGVQRLRLDVASGSKRLNNVWVLVDDIKTTGATLAAAHRALRATDARLRHRLEDADEQGTLSIGQAAIWAAVLGVTPETHEEA